MITKINEVRAALKNGTYIAALALALTLPDICCQVENGMVSGNKNMYIAWIDKHMDNECFTIPLPGFEKQSFKGNMCYSLRCKILHNGNIDVANPNLGVDVDSFILTKPDSKNYEHGYRYVNKIQQDGSSKVLTYIGVDYLCECICDTVENFYNIWPNKSDFDDHTFLL